jgi:hypothetical protein
LDLWINRQAGNLWLREESKGTCQMEGRIEAVAQWRVGRHTCWGACMRGMGCAAAGFCVSSGVNLPPLFKPALLTWVAPAPCASPTSVPHP